MNKRIWIVFLIGVTALGSIYWINYKMLMAEEQELVLADTRLLVVSQGDSLNHILKRLDKEQVIDRSLWLRAYIKLFKQPAILAGVYELLPGMRLDELLRNLFNGRVKQFEITLIEGKTWQDWKDLILMNPAIVNDLDEDALLNELKPEGGTLEGWLMPDTYLITWNTSATQFIKRLYQDMRQFLQQEWENRLPLLPYENAFEALILASIIEKETGLASERPRIAGVFVNRLESGMRLQTDPTVIYGLGNDFDGNLTRQHLRQRTAYNTYVINGLPPTPIAMPGKEAIQAALHPQSTEEFYFVAKGDGSHQFSVTLAEHNAAVRKYQLGISE